MQFEMQKNGTPFNVSEMCFEDFIDIKALSAEMGVQNITQLKISTVVVIQVHRESPNSIFF